MHYVLPFFSIAVKPKDVIFPTVTCPGSQVVTLNQRKKYVTLDGAETKDNTGIKLLEYKAIIKDDSATFEEPDVLVLTRHSLGNTYEISVKTLDLDDNQAFCNYTISVQGTCKILSHCNLSKIIIIASGCESFDSAIAIKISTSHLIDDKQRQMIERKFGIEKVTDCDIKHYSLIIRGTCVN